MNNSPPLNELVDRKKLVRNVFLNLFGYGIPLIVAVFTIPIMIRGLGTDRFGILTLAWVLIGYLGLFDMGLGRALTKLVAEKLGSGLTQDIPELIWTALLIMLGLGVIVALIASMVLPFMARDILKVPLYLKNETFTAFLILILFTPIIIISVGFRGVLDAYQRFDLTNTVRIPLGLFTFIAPLLVMPFSVSLVPLFAVLMAGRLIAMLVQMSFCFRVIPELKNTITIRRSLVGALLKFGGWMTITNIIMPLMMYTDRLFIGSMISVTAVAYYATPGEVITKLLLISGSLMGVLFPAFSSTFVNNRQQTISLFLKGIKVIYVLMFPLALLIIAVAGEGLTIWLGAEFAHQSTLIMQLMTIAIFFISLGQVPYSLIQGVGRPDMTAWLHIIELPFYLFFLYLMIQAFGIRGAAFAWMIRAMIDSTLLYILAQRLLGRSPIKAISWPQLIVLLIAFGCLVFPVFVQVRLSIKLILLCMMILAHLGTAWAMFLGRDEKKMIKTSLFSIRST